MEEPSFPIQIQAIMNELRELRNIAEHSKKQKDRDHQMLKQIQNEQSKNKQTITRLTQEIVTLTEELREYKSEISAYNCANIKEENFLPDLPINNQSKLSEFDRQLLEDKITRDQLKRLFTRCGRETFADFLRFNIRKLITDELSINFTWNGTKDKPSIQKFFFISILKGTCHQTFITITDKNIDRVIQQHFLHAADRVNKRKLSPKNVSTPLQTSAELP